jgi:hypothetical protein
MSECDNCLFYRNCTPDDQLNNYSDEDICDNFVDISNFFGEIRLESQWGEMSYYQYIEDCLDTEQSEYDLYDW